MSCELPLPCYFIFTHHLFYPRPPTTPLENCRKWKIRWSTLSASNDKLSTHFSFIFNTFDWYIEHLAPSSSNSLWGPAFSSFLSYPSPLFVGVIVYSTKMCTKISICYYKIVFTYTRNRNYFWNFLWQIKFIGYFNKLKYSVLINRFHNFWKNLSRSYGMFF